MSKPIAHPIAPRVALPANAVQTAKSAAAGTKTDFKSLLASSLSESRYDPNARNTRSSAAGAFQFTERTWLSLLHKYGGQLGQADAAAKITIQGGKPTVADPADRTAILGLRSDTALAGGIAARYSDENRTHLQKLLGQAPSDNQVRMAYLLGAVGASRLIKAASTQPDTTVDKLIPAAVHSNPGLFLQPGGGPKTAQQAVASLESHFNAAMNRVNSAVGTKLSDALPAGFVPTDELA
jgi:hypothetical protein